MNNLLFSKKLAGAVIALMLLSVAAPTVLHNLNPSKDTEDFAPVYKAAELMRQGKDMYSGTRGLYIYPPFLALLFQPLTVLPERPAAALWTVVSAAIFAAAALIIATSATHAWNGSRRNADLRWSIAAVALLLSLEKINADLKLGQTDCLILLGFACALRWMQRRPAAAGIAIGAIASIKYVSLIFVPYFLLKRNYSAAAAAIGSFVALNLLPILEVGFQHGVHFLIAATAALSKMAEVGGRVRAKIPRITWERSVSITSAVSKWSQHHYLPRPLTFAIVLACFCTLLVLILLISRRAGLPLFRFANPEPSREHVTACLEWACLVVFAIVFSPQAAARHFVVFCGIFVVAAAVAFAEVERARRWVLLIAMLTASLGISFPPQGIGIDQALNVWRALAGPSICAVILLLLVVNFGASLAARDYAVRHAGEHF
jgi:drug/metabolite transporter superfamily protein YnfA